MLSKIKKGWLVARSAFSQLPELKSKNKSKLKFKKRLMTIKYTPFTVFYAFLNNALENKRWVGYWRVAPFNNYLK